MMKEKYIDYAAEAAVFMAVSAAVKTVQAVAFYTIATNLPGRCVTCIKETNQEMISKIDDKREENREKREKRKEERAAKKAEKKQEKAPATVVVEKKSTKKSK